MGFVLFVFLVVFAVMIVVIRLWDREPKTTGERDEPSPVRSHSGCTPSIVFWIGLILLVAGIACFIWFQSRDCCWISPAAFGGGSCPTRDCEDWETRLLGWSVGLGVLGLVTLAVGVGISIWREYHPK